MTGVVAITTGPSFLFDHMILTTNHPVAKIVLKHQDLRWSELLVLFFYRVLVVNQSPSAD